MDHRQVSCLHRGNTFFGAVEILGSDAEALIRVRYNGTVREAPLDGLPVDVVAHLLLRDLVVRDVAAARRSAAVR